MSQSTFEAPDGVCELVEKSVEQTRHAFEAFLGATRQAVNSVEPMLPESARDANARALGYAEANIKAAFDLAQKLARAKDPQEFWRLQSDYAKALADAAQEQMRELGRATQIPAATKTGDASYARKV